MVAIRPGDVYMSKKIIVFDFDGTLVDSSRVKHDAYFDIFSQESQSVQDVAKAVIPHIRGKLRGETIRSILEQTHRELLGTSAFDEKVQEYVQRYDSLVEERIISKGLFVGVRELLERWNSQYRVYLSSGTPHYALESLVNKLNLSHVFHGVYGVDHTRKDGAGVMKKENLFKILQLESAMGADACIVGDGVEDLESAREYGSVFIGIHSDCNTWNAQCEFPVVHSVSEICTIPFFSHV